MCYYLDSISSFKYSKFMYNDIVFNYNNTLFIIRIRYSTIYNYILNGYNIYLS